MKTHHNAPGPDALLHPVLLAPVLTAGTAAGLWLRGADPQSCHLLLLSAVVGLLALVELVWLHRARATRRWRAALDAFADREIARTRHM